MNVQLHYVLLKFPVGHGDGNQWRGREGQTRRQTHHASSSGRFSERLRQNPTHHHLRLAEWRSAI